ncbi:MAG: YkgJ family cysteine cluster protein [Syntrophobacteraceae bacterium]
MDMVQNQKQEPMTETSPFRFACHDALPCFTQCCRDVNIYLTPYDVLRLRKALGGIGSAEFLGRYTRNFLAKMANIPVVQLQMNQETLYCPFVSNSGCTVYGNRPWACRMFPLDIASRGDSYRLIAGKERCMGLLERKSGTVADWIESQGVREYAELEEEYQRVVPERFIPGSPMNEGLGRILFLAYDLDRFTEVLKDTRFLKFYDVDEEMLSRVRENDVELLKLCFRYIRVQMNDLYQVL